MGGISIWQLLIVFAIIVLLFGTKKLRNIGGDLGSAVKGFKKAIGDDKETDKDKEADIEPEQLDQKNQSAEETTKTKEKDQA